MVRLKGKVVQFPFLLVVVVGEWKQLFPKVLFFLYIYLYIFYTVLSIFTVYLLSGIAYYLWVAFFGGVYDRYVRTDHGVDNALCPLCFVRLCLVEREVGV